MSAWAKIRVHVPNKVLVINLVVSCSEKLQKVLFVLRSKITVFIDVLMGSRLNFGSHILFSHHVALLFVSILVFGFIRQLLNQLIVITLSSVLVI